MQQLLEILPACSRLVESSGGDNCVICQHAVVDGEVTRALLCGHSSWHESCLLQWLREQRSCPICRAQLPGYRSSLEPEDGALDELNERLDNFREHLAGRLEVLERERQTLQIQMQSIGAELALFGTQVARLHLERLAFRSTLLTQTDVFEAESDDAVQVEECDDDEDKKEEKAQDMLCRLRGAVLRTPVPAVEVFRTLAGRTGRLGPEQAARVLRGLEEAIPHSVVSRAFAIMDVDGSGFVEEEDWMAALCLPRMSPSTA
eukprot:TRINITY_DN109995_c0_g1_i2.p1 TRINITY_DN109995_c0_g1~~TRINITY_DN109995_c0_g1_i2.p1  ORF type:complete len:296 (+),score=44.99 TRINITY_DN109995_c0_g1_i2:107-889(+)